MKTIKICIAGLGNVGSQVVDSLVNNEQFIFNKPCIIIWCIYDYWCS